ARYRWYSSSTSHWLAPKSEAFSCGSGPGDPSGCSVLSVGSDSLRSALTRGDSEDTAVIAYFRDLKAILARHPGYPGAPAQGRDEISALPLVHLAPVTPGRFRSPSAISGSIKVPGGTITAKGTKANFPDLAGPAW